MIQTIKRYQFYQAPRTILIGDPSLSECVGKHELENKTITQCFVDEFHSDESVCFPLQTRYATNSEIFKCANRLIKYEYANDVKLAEDGANKRVNDCLGPINQEKFARIGLGFGSKLFDKLIARPLVYIDTDLVCSLINFHCV